MPWRIRAPATAFLLTPKAPAIRDIGTPSAESSRSRVIAGASQITARSVGQFVGRRGASFACSCVLCGCPLLPVRREAGSLPVADVIGCTLAGYLVGCPLLTLSSNFNGRLSPRASRYRFASKPTRPQPRDERLP